MLLFFKLLQLIFVALGLTRPLDEAACTMYEDCWMKASFPPTTLSEWVELPGM